MIIHHSEFCMRDKRYPDTLFNEWDILKQGNYVPTLKFISQKPDKFRNLKVRLVHSVAYRTNNNGKEYNANYTVKLKYCEYCLLVKRRKFIASALHSFDTWISDVIYKFSYYKANEYRNSKFSSRLRRNRKVEVIYSF